MDDFGTNEVTQSPLYQAGLGFGVTIDGTEIGLVPNALSVTPDKTYVVQNTGTGRVRVRWPNLQRTGTVDVRFEWITIPQLRELERLCGPSPRPRTFSYAGKTYTTRSFKLSVTPEGEQGRYVTVELEFFAQLPPIAPPIGFGSLLTPETRFTETNAMLADSYQTAQGTLLQTEEGDWFLRSGNDLTMIGSARVQAVTTAERDARTTLLFGWSRARLQVFSIRGGTMRFLKEIVPPEGTQSVRYTGHTLDFLVQDGAGITAISESLATGARGLASWLSPSAPYLSESNRAFGSFVEAGVALVTDPNTVEPCGYPLYVSESGAIPLSVQDTDSGVIYATQQPGLIASAHRVSRRDQVFTLGVAERDYRTVDRLLARQAGIAGEDSPYQVTEQGLSLSQNGFNEIFQYRGVIKVTRTGLLTRYGLYRSTG